MLYKFIMWLLYQIPCTVSILILYSVCLPNSSHRHKHSWDDCIFKVGHETAPENLALSNISYYRKSRWIQIGYFTTATDFICVISSNRRDGEGPLFSVPLLFALYFSFASHDWWAFEQQNNIKAHTLCTHSHNGNCSCLKHTKYEEFVIVIVDFIVSMSTGPWKSTVDSLNILYATLFMHVQEIILWY